MVLLITSMVESQGANGQQIEKWSSGEVDVAAATDFAGALATLRDEAVFASVVAKKDLGAVQWLNAAALDPDVTYSGLTGRSAQLPA